jgi:nucleoid-associated protein YgaU
MARYKNTEIKLDGKTAKYSYNTTYYGGIPETDNDIFVITQIGDRLDLLAHQFYGDVSFWWYIAKANGLNDLRVEAGKSLRIPATTEFAIGQ